MLPAPDFIGIHMYAVIQSGGKQYKVAKDDIVKLEKLPGEAGSVVEFDTVLLLDEGNGSVKLGAPFVANALVSAEVIRQGKDDKIIVFKKKRRHNYRRKKGHRQQMTWLKVTDISASGERQAKPAASQEPKQSKPEAEETAKAPATAPKKAAGEKAAQPKDQAAAKPAAKKASKPKE